MSGIIESLLPVVDSILGVRDTVGAVLKPVSLLTRTWTGNQPGDGAATDLVTRILPSPGIREYAHDLKIQAGGAIQQGDVVVTGVSKNQYPTQDLIDGSCPSANIEKFYLVGEAVYQVINVKENYLTWDVQLRRLSSQARYGNG